MTDVPEKRPRGRPPVVADLGLLEELGGLGLTAEECCDALGVSRRWLFDDQNAEALAIFRQGRVAAKIENIQRVEVLARSGNIAAIKLRLDILDRNPRDAPSAVLTIAFGNQRAPVTIDSVTEFMEEQRVLIEGPKN